MPHELLDASEIDCWNRDSTTKFIGKLSPIVKRWFRSEVRNIERIPEGPALTVSNHSGGMFTPDPLILGAQYYQTFGYDRPLYILAHNTVMDGPQKAKFLRLGVVHASRENASAALRSGATVLVFPGGDYDSYRPSSAANVIDFNGRTGYVTTAIEAGVPIVPTVSVGAQHSQLFLTRGTGVAKRLKLDERLRLKILPVSVGFPFGVSVILPPNLPLPTKITTQVLEPIDIEATFGTDPDVNEVDRYVRSVMQIALDALAAERRFPIIG
ncbi:MAG TPA: lysophospholipid acyltransferase family protein [Thermomicrobiales bacterium]|nr:lysophospholipid acyltransferase family protein [Thermomicrobiales bacterium]